MIEKGKKWKEPRISLEEKGLDGRWCNLLSCFLAVKEETPVHFYSCSLDKLFLCILRLFKVYLSTHVKILVRNKNRNPRKCFWVVIKLHCQA